MILEFSTQKKTSICTSLTRKALQKIIFGFDLNQSTMD